MNSKIICVVGISIPECTNDLFWLKTNYAVINRSDQNQFCSNLEDISF